MRKILAIGFASIVAACAAPGPDANGNWVLTERSEALGNLSQYVSTGKAGPTLVTYKPCNAQDISGCGYSDNRAAIIAAWKAGKLYVENDGKKTLVPLSAKGE